MKHPRLCDSQLLFFFFVKFCVFLARLCFLVHSWAKKFLFFSIKRQTFLAWLGFAVWAVFQALACRSLASMALTQTGVLTLGCMWPAKMVTNPLHRKLLCLLLKSFFKPPSPFLRLMNFSPCWLAHWFLYPIGDVLCKDYTLEVYSDMEGIPKGIPSSGEGLWAPGSLVHWTWFFS